MKRFTNILFISESIKGNEVALQHAAKLAHSNHARLTVIDCSVLAIKPDAYKCPIQFN